MLVNYPTLADSNNPHAWSGTIYHLANALEANGITLNRISNLDQNTTLYQKLTDPIVKLLNINRHYYRYPSIGRNIAKQCLTKLTTTDQGFIFSPSTIPIAYLNSPLKKITYCDATFACMLDYDNHFKHLSRNTIKYGHQSEQRAIDNADMLIYASDWAAQSAIKDYGANPEKIKIVPFGANLTNYPDKTTIENLIYNKQFDVCKLLFVGLDWHRKGGDRAVNIATDLNKLGIPTELHIVGGKPDKIKSSSFLHYHGFLSKHNPHEYQQLMHLYQTAHFFLLPAKAEAFGIVLSEANAYGLPALASHVGGIPTVIRDHKNGKVFSNEDHSKPYIDFIAELFHTKNQYRQLALSSYHEFITRLNWDSSTATIKQYLELL